MSWCCGNKAGLLLWKRLCLPDAKLKKKLHEQTLCYLLCESERVACFHCESEKVRAATARATQFFHTSLGPGQEPRESWGYRMETPGDKTSFIGCPSHLLSLNLIALLWRHRGRGCSLNPALLFHERKGFIAKVKLYISSPIYPTAPTKPEVYDLKYCEYSGDSNCFVHEGIQKTVNECLLSQYDKPVVTAAHHTWGFLTILSRISLQ